MSSELIHSLEVVEPSLETLQTDQDVTEMLQQNPELSRYLSTLPDEELRQELQKLKDLVNEIELEAGVESSEVLSETARQFLEEVGESPQGFGEPEIDLEVTVSEELEYERARAASRKELFNFASERLQNPSRSEVLDFSKKYPKALEAYIMDKNGVINFQGIDKKLLGLGHLQHFVNRFQCVKIETASEVIYGVRDAAASSRKPGYRNVQTGKYCPIFTGDRAIGMTAEELGNESGMTLDQLASSNPQSMESYYGRAKRSLTSYESYQYNRGESLAPGSLNLNDFKPNLGEGIEGQEVVVQPGNNVRTHPDGYIYRSDRHNNPIASNWAGSNGHHTRLLKEAGLVEGVDFWPGEPGPGAGKDMGTPTVAYKDFKTGVIGSVMALRSGQVGRWYGRIGGHAYGYNEEEGAIVNAALNQGGANITSHSTPQEKQAVFDGLTLEQQQQFVMAIYQVEGGGNMFRPITPGEETLAASKEFLRNGYSREASNEEVYTFDENSDNIDDPRVQPDLKKLHNTWEQLLTDKGIKEGREYVIFNVGRSMKQHQENLAKGYSTAEFSKHLYGAAFDAVPLDSDGNPTWRPDKSDIGKRSDIQNAEDLARVQKAWEAQYMPLMKQMGEAWRTAANENNIEVRWGALQRDRGDFPTFFDPYHYELGRSVDDLRANVVS